MSGSIRDTLEQKLARFEKLESDMSDPEVLGDGARMSATAREHGGLAKVAGYKSPGWQEADTVKWLTAWGEAFGREELVQILKEQGVDKDAKYLAVVNKLKSS